MGRLSKRVSFLLSFFQESQFVLNCYCGVSSTVRRDPAHGLLVAKGVCLTGREFKCDDGLAHEY